MSDLFAYKVLTADQFAQFKADGVFSGAPVDLADGYIHMSTRDQAAETVAKHFAGQDRLVLLMIDLAPFGEAVKWEVSRGGALFPHLYGDLPMSAVAGKVVLRIGEDGKHLFPAGF
ncbi:DUF952 domain-containing protein [Sphingobium amiense]|uniref:DUF952 domain-containing protein n=1 Tax=Sphingobium amiense TaxID=135719 RepID=A0A494WA50_9SPHN|nr:DUF952 domain-containing protein [Sphingobium amiense]BBD97325.1 DUF952 domain-containing protein [Sphingobium amiense]